MSQIFTYEHLISQNQATVCSVEIGRVGPVGLHWKVSRAETGAWTKDETFAVESAPSASK